MKTIYLVHDQQMSPAGRQNLLEMAGYRVQLMKGGRELEAALKEEQPDLLVLDVLIEGKNGFEVTKDVNAKHRRRRFPILLCSRIYRARQFREEALRSGAQDYVLLPVKPDSFLERVTRALAEFPGAGNPRPGTDEPDPNDPDQGVADAA